MNLLVNDYVQDFPQPYRLAWSREPLEREDLL